jgi:Type IX secretion system protein PorV
MKKILHCSNVFFFFLLNYQSLIAQCDPWAGKDPSGRPCISYITPKTTLPFLRIITDARSGAMGDVGIALTPDANSIVYNASKLAMADKKWGIAVNYTPWQRKGFNSEMYVKHAAGYYQFGKKKKQAIGLDARLFSFGLIQWEDYNSLLLRYGTPKEMALTASYSRQINDNWVVGLAAKSIHSTYMINFLFPKLGRKNGLKQIKTIAFDISTTYKKAITIADKETNVYFGAVIANLGNKFDYGRFTDNLLPANLGLGGSWEVSINKNNKFLAAIECKKRLSLTPSPYDTTDNNLNKIADWKEISVAKSIFQSFSDAPDGLKGELREITTSLGLEYWLMQHFVLRAGYAYENPNAGGLQFYTFGGGVRYRVFDLNVSYLKMAQNPSVSPIDNTWRFSLLINGLAFKEQNKK